MDSQRMHVIANKPRKEPPLPIIAEPFESNYRPRVPLDNDKEEEAQNFSFFVEDASGMANDIPGRGEHLPEKGDVPGSVYTTKPPPKRKPPHNNGPVSVMEAQNRSFFVEDASGMANDIPRGGEHLPGKGDAPGSAYTPKPPPKRKPPHNNGPVLEVEAQNRSFSVEDASGMTNDIPREGEHLPGKGDAPGSAYIPKPPPKRKPPHNNQPVSEVEAENRSFFVDDASGMANDIPRGGEHLPGKGDAPGSAYTPKPPPKRKPPQNNQPVSEVEAENRSFFVDDASGMTNDIPRGGEHLPGKGDAPGSAYTPKPPPKRKPPHNNGPVSVMEAQNRSFFVEDASGMANDIPRGGEHLPGKGDAPGSAYTPKPPPKRKPPHNNGPVLEVEAQNRSFSVEDASGMTNDIPREGEHLPGKGDAPGSAYTPKPPPKRKPPHNNQPVSEVEAENHSFFVDDASGMANDIPRGGEHLPGKGDAPGSAYTPKPPPKRKPPHNNELVSEVEAQNRSFFVDDASGMANGIPREGEHLPGKGDAPGSAYTPKPPPKRKPPQNNRPVSEVEAENRSFFVDDANLMASNNGRKHVTRNAEQQGEVQNGTTRAADTTLQKSPRASPDRYVMRAQITSDKRHALFKTWEEREQAKAEIMANKKQYSLELWANSAKAALEAEMRQIQEKYAEKMNKLAEVNRTTEEKKALLEASRKEEFLKLEEMAAQIRATGYKPKKRLMSCFSCINFSD